MKRDRRTAFFSGNGLLGRRDFLRLTGAGAVALSTPAIVRRALAQSDEWPLEGKDLSVLGWDGGPLVDSMMAKVQEAWPAKGGGKLNFRKVPSADLDRTVRAANQGSDFPDVFMADSPNIITYVALGLIEPVTDMFTAEDLADFFPVVRKSAEIKGEFYGPSTNENGQCLFYDRKLTSRYGIEPPGSLDQGWTWDKALEAFLTIQKEERKRRGTDQFWAHFMTDYDVYYMGHVPRSNGALGSSTYKYVSDDGRTVDGYLNAPEALEGLQFLQDLFVKHGSSPLPTQTDYFYNDQVAFWQCPPFFFSEIKRRRPDIDLASTTVPFLKTPGVHTGAFAWLLNVAAPNRNDAKQLIRFLGSAEGNDIVSREFTSPPIRRSMIANRPELKEPPLALFVDTLNNWALQRPVTPGFSEYSAIWTRLSVDVTSGGNVEQLAKKAVADIDRQLSRYYRA